ncbi:MAG: MerR family DNA-binding transcriptional regulator [Alphaproteobacteria bacterium]|nr:MerR family DNA-binding transcriptional regulator [Alphaproteobacteria bacterium]
MPATKSGRFIAAPVRTAERSVSIGEAARVLGVSITTLRRWEATGRLQASHTTGGHRRYDLAKLRPEMFRAEAEAAAIARTIALASVAGDSDRQDLERQKKLLARYCGRQGWSFRLITDPGGTLALRRKALTGLLEALASGEIDRLVITEKDRLRRLGGEGMFAICEAGRVELVMLNQSGDGAPDEGITAPPAQNPRGDVLEFIAAFAARIAPVTK